MSKSRILHGLIAGMLALSSFVAAAVTDPQAMIRETGERILGELAERKPELEADPSLIYPLVQETILPHFDFRRMSQSAMGPFWRRATDDQKSRITIEFRQLLVRTYASALLAYTDEKVEYLPVQIPDGKTEVTIPTRLSSNNAPPIPVSYRLRLDDQQAWKVYDVVIDGVSLITNYRSQFRAAVRRQGIDGLIATLASKNRTPR